MEATKRVALAWNVLRFSYALVLLLAGLDKVFATNLIASWHEYISPPVLDMLPVGADVFLIAMGIIEIAVAVMLATSWPRIAGYLSVVWLTVIAVNLVMMGYLDIAVRDFLLAVGAFVLAELTVAAEELKLTRATM